MSISTLTHKPRATVRPKRPRPSRQASAVIPIGFTTPVMQALPAAVQRIVEHLHPEKIILFGSYAYGTPTPDSDVDLLVVMRTRKPHKERSWAVSRLLIPRPFPVDILVVTPTELAQALKQRHYFFQDITAYGRVLYERL